LPFGSGFKAELRKAICHALDRMQHLYAISCIILPKGGNRGVVCSLIEVFFGFN
tara:strand:- start:10128 stop:10289 length:162 start_codon:yes stop_codon:yes gene_type:complete